MKIKRFNPLFSALPSVTKPRFGRSKAKPPKKIKKLYPPHQLSNRCPQRFGNGLNCKKTRIFHAPFYAAQKCPVNVGFGSERILRQFSLHSEFPDLMTKLFGNIVTHLRQCCPFAMANGCRLYTTTPLDNQSARCHDHSSLIFKQEITRQAHELCRDSSGDRANFPQKGSYTFLMADEGFLTEDGNILKEMPKFNVL
jgi:hypothetical protein